MAGVKDILRWLVNYFNFGFYAGVSALVGSWFPSFLGHIQPWLEPRYPALWLRLLAQSYALTAGMGRPHNVQTIERGQESESGQAKVSV